MMLGKKVTLWFVLLNLIGLTNFAFYESRAGVLDRGHEGDSFPSARSENPPPTLKNLPADNDGSAQPLSLTLQDFIRLVRKENEQILFQDAEWAISREAVKGAEAIFEPAFVGNYQSDYTRRRQTVQEIVQTGFRTPIFFEDADNYEAAVEGFVPTGAKVRLGYSLRSFQTIFDQEFGVDREYSTFLGAEITQPLLKGGGITTTMAGIRVAEMDSDIAFQDYRAQMMKTISEAIAAYWNLYSAQEKYKVLEESVHIAEEILKDNRVRVRTGKMAETEVLEAEAGLALRRSLLSEAKQEIVFAMNNVRTLFSSSAAEKDIPLEAVDRLQVDEVEPDFLDSLLKAFKLRPEYISSRRKLEREDIKIVFAKNQRWPQLDLKGSYGVNGLATSFTESWDDAWDTGNKTWYVGVELRIPLAGDKRSRSELEATKQRKKQALLELKSVEVATANALHTAIRSLRSALEQVRYYASAVDFNERLLKAEAAKVRAGKSNTRLLLEKEEDLIRAREAEIDSLLKYKRAILQLGVAEGSLLIRHNIEEMEVDL
jgi:outer membrane protein TolC